MILIEDEKYQPKSSKNLKSLPTLYAFRMTSLEIGAISLAQGSPSEGPPAHVITNNALAMLDWASNQSSVDPKQAALIRAFLKKSAKLSGKTMPSIELTGYPDIRIYKETQAIAANFLAREFKTDFSLIGSPENHIIIDNYSRHLLNLTLKTLRSTNEDATARENKKRNVVLTYNGHWPLVSDLVKDNDYTLVHLHPKKIDELNFEDFRSIIGQSPQDANIVIYINNPNNPLSTMYAHEQQEKFLLDVARFNRNQEEAGISRRVRVLSDNAYWGWIKPEYIQEKGFPFFAKAAFSASNQTNLPVQQWLIECFSLGKVFGLASVGASFGFVGDANLNAKILQLQTRDTNMPGADKLAIISQTLETMDMGHLVLRASAINDNLVSACTALTAAKRDANLPIDIMGNPEHGAYISVELSPTDFLNRRVIIEGKVYDVANMLELCIFLLEKHGIAVALNDQADLPNTIRLFVDAPKDILADGVNRISRGLTELLNAPRVPSSISFSVPYRTADNV